jgi:hypothetical protein
VPGGVTLISFVPNGYYYEITGTSLSVIAWDEFSVVRGTLSDSAELSGSRAVSTVYRNTSGSTMFLQVQSAATTTAITVVSDATASPTATVWNHRPVTSSILSTFIPIPNNHYYEVTGITIGSWREPTLSGSVVKSVNLAATYPSLRMALQSAWNTSGYSTFISVVAGAVTGKYTQSFFADTACPPTGSDYAMEGTGTGLTSVLGVAQPWDFTYTSMDGSTYPITAWWEWNLTP